MLFMNSLTFDHKTTHPPLQQITTSTSTSTTNNLGFNSNILLNANRQPNTLPKKSAKMPSSSYDDVHYLSQDLLDSMDQASSSQPKSPYSNYGSSSYSSGSGSSSRYGSSGFSSSSSSLNPTATPFTPSKKY